MVSGARRGIEWSGFKPWPAGHCVVFLRMTLYSQGASLHPFNAGGGGGVTL